jgi:hypothetical protein
MKINGPNSLRGTTAARSGRVGQGSGGGFSLSTGGAAETSGTTSLSAGASIGSLDALLAMQSVDDSLHGRRKARARAEDILDRLDELRRGILLGAVSRDRLGQLAQLVRSQRAEVDDPRLAELLDEIDLRAQVELAKLATAREPMSERSTTPAV